MKTLIFRYRYLLAVWLVTLLPEMVRACPGCAESLGSELGAGLNASIMFMLAMPFAVTGAVAAGIFIVFHRAKSSSKKKRISHSSENR